MCPIGQCLAHAVVLAALGSRQSRIAELRTPPSSSPELSGTLGRLLSPSAEALHHHGASDGFAPHGTESAYASWHAFTGSHGHSARL